MKHTELVRVKDVMKTQFDLIHGIETVEDALASGQALRDGMSACRPPE